MEYGKVDLIYVSSKKPAIEFRIKEMLNVKL
jgi:hypothetical protein